MIVLPWAKVRVSFFLWGAWGAHSTWICLFASAYFLSMAAATITERAVLEVKRFQSGLAVCTVASLVEMAVAAEICHDQKSCRKKQGFAVAVGAIAASVCIITMVYLKFSGNTHGLVAKFLGALLAGTWAVGAAVNTSKTGYAKYWFTRSGCGLCFAHDRSLFFAAPFPTRARPTGTSARGSPSSLRSFTRRRCSSPPTRPRRRCRPRPTAPASPAPLARRPPTMPRRAPATKRSTAPTFGCLFPLMFMCVFKKTHKQKK